MPENPDYHATFLGEFCRAPALAEYDPIFDPRKKRHHGLKGIGSPFIYTSGAYYSQKNPFDCSVDEGFHIILPRQWLVKNDEAPVEWIGGPLFRFRRKSRRIRSCSLATWAGRSPHSQRAVPAFSKEQWLRNNLVPTRR